MNFINTSEDSTQYLLRFEKGELLISELTKFIKEKDIQSGWVSAIGGLAWAELGFYDLSSQEYSWQKFEELLELTSLLGNIAWSGDSPVLHLHANVSDASFHAYGGHLKEAEVAGTVELKIGKLGYESRIERTLDENTGLNLLNI